MKWAEMATIALPYGETNAMQSRKREQAASRARPRRLA